MVRVARARDLRSPGEVVPGAAPAAQGSMVTPDLTRGMRQKEAITPSADDATLDERDSGERGQPVH